MSLIHYLAKQVILDGQLFSFWNALLEAFGSVGQLLRSKIQTADLEQEISLYRKLLTWRDAGVKTGGRIGQR